MELRSDNGKTYKSVRIHRRSTPDGLPWTEQEHIVTEVFNTIANEIREASRRG